MVAHCRCSGSGGMVAQGIWWLIGYVVDHRRCSGSRDTVAHKRCSGSGDMVAQEIWWLIVDVVAQEVW
jgi:hypothetical protein